MPFRYHLRFEKGEKSLAEGGLELGLIVLQSMHCNHYTIEADAS